MSALERVYLAATTICGELDVHKRVEYAVIDMVPLLDNDYPPELWPLKNSIVQRCTRHGSIPESVPRLSNQEAVEVAQRILELYVRLRLFEGPEGDWCGGFADC